MVEVSKKLQRVLIQKLKILHQSLLNLRNDVYANSDVSARDIKPIIFKKANSYGNFTTYAFR
eukprot:UN03349